MCMCVHVFVIIIPCTYIKHLTVPNASINPPVSLLLCHSFVDLKSLSCHFSSIAIHV